MSLARTRLGKEARRLLLDHAWLAAKLQTNGIQAAIDDYEHLAPQRLEPLGLVRDALRLSAHVLDPRPEELGSQLIGRLATSENPELRELVRRARAERSRRRLQPVWGGFDAPGGSVVQTLPLRLERITALAITNDSKTLIAARDGKHHGLVDRYGVLTVWDLEAGKLLHTLEGHRSHISAVVITPDGKTAVSASWDKTVRIWDLQSGRLLRTLTGHRDWVEAVALTADGTMLLSGSRDWTLRLWEVESGRLVRTLRAQPNRLVAFMVKLVDLSQEGALFHTVKDWPEYRHGALTITGDSSMVVSSAKAGNALNVWVLDTGAPIQVFEGHRSEVMAATASPDGRMIFSGSQDGMLVAWDVRSGKTLATFTGDCPFTNLEALDDRSIVAGDALGRVHRIELLRPD